MPTAGGPNTLGESNLVFAYDTGDVKNSYIGEPTTNVATGTLTPYTPYNTMTRSGQDLTITMVGGSALYLTFHNGTDYNGQTITLSGYMFKNGTPHTLPNNRANTYHTVAASKWYFDSVTGYFEIVEVCNASSIWLFHTPSGASGGDVITILDFQVEVKTHATPFVNGTRSATQGLLPLAGTGSVDLSNVSFDSSAKMVFDGTNDYIYSSVTLGTEITLEIVIQSSNYSGNKIPISINGDAYSSGPNLYFTNNIIAWNTGNGDANPFANSYYPNSNYHHITVTNVFGGTAILYIDGIQIGTATSLNTTTTGANKLIIGDYHDGGYAISANIPITKFYNRALTAQEVKQNYQQYKTRFNLS